MRKTRGSVFAAGLVLGASTLLLISGCAAGGGSEEASTTTLIPGIDSGSNNQEEVATKSQLKACELVNATEASEIMGEPARVQEGYDPNDGSVEEDVWASTCVYQAGTPENGRGLVIMVLEGLTDSARTENDAFHAAGKAQGNGVDVPGLGDQAFSVPGSMVGVDDIFVKKGNIWFSTSAGFATADATSIRTVSDPEQNMKMLKLILSKL